jgi:hypothetical protein
MDEQVPRIGAEFGRRWIKAPQPPDEATLERLRARCSAEPRIVQAWLTGSRMTPSDGSPAYETTDIALVLDPPEAPGDESDQAAVTELIAQLDGCLDIGARRGWLSVSEAQIRRQTEHAVLLYTRA